MNSESEEISKLKMEIETLKTELYTFKRAIFNIPDLGEKVQKKLWEL